MARLRWFFARARTLRAQQWLQLAEAFAAMLAARLALALLPTRRLVRPLARAPGRRPPVHHPETVRWAVEAVARRSPIRFVCFPQCLAAEWMLRRRGIPSILHYGVRRDSGRLLAHTWLETAGRPFLGDGSGFSAFDETWRD